MLVQMHAGRWVNTNPPALRSLFTKDLIVYSEGWKLTLMGKRLARHLTGRK